MSKKNLLAALLVIGVFCSADAAGPADTSWFVPISFADFLAGIGLVVALIALALTGFVYWLSKKDLDQFNRTTSEAILRWSEATIRIEHATSRIEKDIDGLSSETFSLLKEHYVRMSGSETGVAARELATVDKLVDRIQAEGHGEIEKLLKQPGISVDDAPALQSQLSAVFVDSLRKTRAAADFARDDVLRAELLRVVAANDAQSLTLARLEDLMSESYSRSDIASAIESLKLSGAILLTPDAFQPETVVRTPKGQ